MGDNLGAGVNALKEPLLHFALAGAVLFGGYALLNRGEPRAADAEAIHIGDGEVRWLRETFTNQWRREPTSDELKGLVESLLEEELLAREARALGRFLRSWRGVRDAVLGRGILPGAFGGSRLEPGGHGVAKKELRLTDQFRFHVREDAVEIERQAKRGAVSPARCRAPASDVQGRALDFVGHGQVIGEHGRAKVWLHRRDRALSHRALRVARMRCAVTGRAAPAAPAAPLTCELVLPDLPHPLLS